MIISESFITDTDGRIKDVIIPYETFKKIESILLDAGIAKAIEEISEEEDVSLDEAQRIIKNIDDDPL
jgi:deoxyhypusine synthase